jgi:hypothetical protein
VRCRILSLRQWFAVRSVVRDEQRRPEGPTVVYIVGLGRSGSTLLERILGAVPGFGNFGELNALFTRVAAGDQRCGCGEPFSSCPFWQKVGAHAYGGWDEVTARVCELQPALIRQRYIPYLLAPRTAPAGYRRHLEEYVDVHRRLYASLAEVSGVDVVVDASKSAAQLFALRHIRGLDLRVLNLVRDSRGVAHSWSKTDIEMPNIRDNQARMRTYPPHRAALLWSALQLESSLLQQLATHSGRLRYEDLVERPRETVDAALGSIGLPPQPGWLDHVHDRSVTLDSSHGVAGSRSRFQTGRIELELDEVWRSTLPADARRLVTAITLPQLVSYGYVGPSKGSTS